MKTVTFSQLRNQAKKYFDAVERGETVQVYRHGKPVAVIVPAQRYAGDRWRKAYPVELTGALLSDAILADRSHAR